MAKLAALLARDSRPRRWRVLALSVVVESSFMVAIGSVQATRHVLGLPGSVMALVAVVAGALGGPLVGLLTALAGGAVFAATVASFGARGAWPATIASITLWTVTALLSAALAVALRRQTTRLAEASQRLQEAQRLALLGSWELDIKEGSLSWSEEIYRIFELDPTVFGASYEAFLGAIHPDDLRTHLCAARPDDAADRVDGGILRQ
jgi:PAS domain-containing protein